MSSFHNVHIPPPSQRPSNHLLSYGEVRRQRVSIASASDAEIRITGLLHHTRQVRERGALSALAPARGLCGRAGVIVSPAVAFCGAFLSLLINIILSWPDQSLKHNAWQLGSLALLCIAAANAAFAYRRHQKELEEERLQQEHDAEIEFTLSQLGFLGKSARMALDCREKELKELKIAFLDFQIEMTKCRKGEVPDDLRRRWNEVGNLLENPNPQEAVLVLIETRILPKINYYTAQLHDRLFDLGYGPEEEEESSSIPIVIVDNPGEEKEEETRLVSSAPSASYGVHIQKD